MPRSSVADPLPVITPLECPQPETTIDSLRRCFLEACLVPTTHKAIHDFSHTLIAGIFRFVGSDIQEYRQCLNACVNACKTTGVFRADSWNSWGGFAALLTRMEKVERLTRHTGMLHCISAPTLVVAIAVQQDFDCYKKAATAIYYYDMNYRQEILTLDQVWKITPFAIQDPPNQTIDQLKARTVSQKIPTPRLQGSSEVITLDDEQIPVKRESSVASQALVIREQRREEAIPVPAQVQVPMQMPMAMPMTMTVPAQMTVPTPMPIPTPTSIPTLMPSMVRETLKEVFRGDMMTKLQPLLDRLKSENWNGIIQRDIMGVLTEKNVRVLPSLAKNTLYLWADRSQNAMLKSWLAQAQDDVDVLQWTERYVEPVPSAWTNPQSAHALFHELDAMIMGIPQLTIRGPIQAKMNMLRGIFDQQEKIHKDEMLHRVDNLQLDIAKLHDQMAESKQAEGQATSKSAGQGNDAEESDEDVVVIETDEDADENMEDGGKKKKNKKKRKVEEEVVPKKAKKRKVEEKAPKKAAKKGGKNMKKKKKKVTTTETKKKKTKSGEDIKKKKK
ncbi:hypothetical protein THAR02_09672 [Trichoderma harzianum]|uniref:Uncharacterized protein n=1 Tax=Trichoderma harzianum TaxID=5544 RepID=A0A0F9ZCN3_TRIHA|nr:hypothetical protein THAR02_09672 [Trichoderma harzianum]